MICGGVIIMDNKADGCLVAACIFGIIVAILFIATL